MIRRFFEKFLCKHKWKTHKTIGTYDKTVGMEMPVIRTEILTCENCGKIKIITVQY